MLTDYIREAIRLAHYELTENARLFATIRGLRGVWAKDATFEMCREERQSTVEDWLMPKLCFGDTNFAVLAGIDINPWPGYAAAN